MTDRCTLHDIACALERCLTSTLTGSLFDVYLDTCLGATGVGDVARCLTSTPVAPLLGPATGLHHAAAPMTRRLGPAASAFHLVVCTGTDTLLLGPRAWRSPACQMRADSSGRASCRSGSGNLRAPLRHRQCQLSGRGNRLAAMKPLSFRLLQAATFWSPLGPKLSSL